MNQRRFGIFELDGDITRETEVGILVDRTRDETRNVGGRSKYMRKRVGEGRGSLNCCKVDLANIITESSSDQGELIDLR